MSAEPPRIFTLPLFPLGSVLFPQFPLQLHIFEERYKVMINQCIENDAPFGVILIREGREVGKPASPHDVGCVARILGVERLRDGRMNLLAVCERRFRVLDYMEAEHPYLIGRVEDLDDLPEKSDVSDLTSALTEVFVRYLTLLAQRANLFMPELELPDDPKTLAFCVASVAMLSPMRQQELLEMTDTRARLEDELRLLREQIQELEADSDSNSDSKFESIAAQIAGQDEDDVDVDAMGKENKKQDKKQDRERERERDILKDDDEDGPQVLVAYPLDLQSRRWKEYQHGMRH